MASIRKDILIEVGPDDVWAAVRDVGAVHERLGPGFLTDSRLDGDARVVTFANGMVLRELIVDIDDEARRCVWAAVGGRLAHHNASMQVLADGQGRCRLVWIADFLPHELAPDIGALIEQAAAVIKPTLERRARGAGTCHIPS
jgi:Polyketide cyclase / dehydrase and lipid transport